MSIDVVPLGQMVAEVMDELEEHFGDQAEVGVFGVCLEVLVDDGAEGRCHVVYRCSDARRWVQAAFFEEAAEVAREGSDLGAEDGE